MADVGRWVSAARNFFDDRAASLREVPTLEDLCWVSGRDPRLWSDESLYRDLIDSIVEQAAIGPGDRVLEIGCASGFLARGVAPRCGSYVGLDMAEEALKVARRLGIAHAAFRRGDATGTGLESASFDRVFSYDVFTNFPSFAVAESVVREMWRLVRPGGRVLVGSLPDREKAEEAAARAAALDRELTRRSGPAPTRAEPGPSGSRWHALRRRLSREKSEIVCYDFLRSDFEQLGQRLGCPALILEIHAENPYRGCRFNVVYAKPE